MNRARAAGIVVVLVLAAGCRPVVLSTYGSRVGVGRAHGGDPQFRRTPHRGVDFRVDQLEGPVLAAAGGIVMDISADGRVGTNVVIRHPRFGRWTRYLHLGRALVAPGEVVRRGQVIGEVGLFEASGGVVHVHLELCTNGACAGRRLGGTEDPLAIAAGCFRSDAAYPADRLVLTYPVRC